MTLSTRTSTGEQQRQHYDYRSYDDDTLPPAAYYRHPYPLALDTSPSERFSSIVSSLTSISHLNSSALLDYFERNWAPRRAVVSAEAAWELYPPVAVPRSEKRAKPSPPSVSDPESKCPRDGAIPRFSSFCECGMGSPTHGLPWCGVAGVKWCSECPYRPSVAVDMTREPLLRVHEDAEEEQWGGTGTDTPGLLSSLADVHAGVAEPAHSCPSAHTTTVIVSRPVVPGSNSNKAGVVQNSSRATRPRPVATATITVAATDGYLDPTDGCLNKKKRSRTAAADAAADEDSYHSQRSIESSLFFSRRGSGDERGRRELVANNLLAPAHIEAAFASSPEVAPSDSAVVDSDTTGGLLTVRVCECGDRLPSYGIRGDKTATWCPICPTKPDGAINMRPNKCECGKHAPSFGPQGGRHRDARWCSKCPTKPEDAVDLKSKRCVCGRAQASIGIAGMGASSAKWCKLCPTKPKHAVNVKAKRCECGKVQAAYMGFLGGSWSSARWCRSCPNKPEGVVNVKAARKRCKR